MLMPWRKRYSIGTSQERKNVSDGNEHYPMGQWILQHPAGYVMAAVSQILIEETCRQGYLSSLNALALWDVFREAFVMS